MSTVPQQPTALPVAAATTATTTATSTPSQPSSPDAKKVGSDGEDFSDTANETGTFEVRIYAQISNDFFFQMNSYRLDRAAQTTRMYVGAK